MQKNGKFENFLIYGSESCSVARSSNTTLMFCFSANRKRIDFAFGSECYPFCESSVQKNCNVSTFVCIRNAKARRLCSFELRSSIPYIPDSKRTLISSAKKLNYNYKKIMAIVRYMNFPSFFFDCKFLKVYLEIRYVSCNILKMLYYWFKPGVVFTKIFIL